MGEPAPPTDAAPPGQATTPDATEARVEHDLPCYKCGYNLRSLRVDADCPECGYEVEQSAAMIVTQRWPFTAEKPCHWLSFGLFTMFVLGIGLIPWTIGVAMITWRLPSGLYWSAIRHASWLSLVGVIASITLIFLIGPFGNSPLDINTIVAVFSVSLLVHYLCVFLLAIGISSGMQQPVAMGVAIICLFTQLSVVTLTSASHGTMYGLAMVLMLSGFFWMALGTFYWLYVANTLGEQKQALILKSMGTHATPIPTHTL